MFTFGNKKEEIPNVIEIVNGDVLFYHSFRCLTIRLEMEALLRDAQQAIYLKIRQFIA